MPIYEDDNWLCAYSPEDCLWLVISPLGVIVTRTFNKEQAIELVNEMNSQKGDRDGKPNTKKPR